jgi:hypothetical protein
VTLSVTHGDWQFFLGRGGFLGIERAGAGARGRKGGWGKVGRGVSGDSRILIS